MIKLKRVYLQPTRDEEHNPALALKQILEEPKRG